MAAGQSFEEWLQSRLTAHGFPCGAIDGKIGNITVAAIKAFQVAKGMPVTGTSDPATVTALRLSSTAHIAAIQVPDREPAPGKVGGALAAGPWPRQADMTKFYGAVGANQTTIQIPFAMVLAWDKSIPARKMTLNAKCADSARRVLEQVAQVYNERERADLGLNLFGGSLNVRRMRGGTAYSMHSWGAAIDFDPERNGLRVGRPQARLSHADAVPFWEAWEKEGWLSLGRARNMDWMHVQAARL